jgi:transposase
MWTEEQRRIYRREGSGYPSDLRDAERARLEPLIPPARPGGRPRKTDMRAAMNAAILYLLRTGCPWRYLPRDSFPPRATVYRSRGPLGICRNQKQILNQSMLWCAFLLQKLRELELVKTAMPHSLPLMADK